MAKKTKVWLLIGAALILAGCMIFGGAMMGLGWDFTKLSTVKFETNTYDIPESFRNISVVTDTADLAFVPAEDGKCVVVCREFQNAKHRVRVKDDTLIVEPETSRKWYDHIGIIFGSPEITVYLPEDTYKALAVKESTGRVEIPGSFSFDTIDISTDTGDVTNRASTSGRMRIKATTGGIRLEGISAGSLDLSVSTGKVNVQNITCDGELKVKVSTGGAEIADVQCGSFAATGDTGDLIMKNVVALGGMSISRSTGDVKFERCDASELYIELNTGDVSGSLLSDKVFIAQSETGRVNVPKSVTGGRCEITTDTGDIKIIVEK